MRKPYSRRTRRRPSAALTFLVLAIVLLLFFVIGGISEINNVSAPYDRATQGSFQVQAVVVADQSNLLGSQLEDLLITMPQLDRMTLESRLGALVKEASVEEMTARGLANPRSKDQLKQTFVQVMSYRASALEKINSGVEGLLGIQPSSASTFVSTYGSRPARSSTGLNLQQLSPALAAQDLGVARALVLKADQRYEKVIGDLKTLLGASKLPKSDWSVDSQRLRLSSAMTLASSLASSSTLAPVERLVLTTVRVNPIAIPVPTASSTASSAPNGLVLPPTSSVSVSPVISNEGNVVVSNAKVTLSFVRLTGSVTKTVSKYVSLGPNRSVTLSSIGFKTVPGQTYDLTVSILAPSEQVNPSSTQIQSLIQIAPS